MPEPGHVAIAAQGPALKQVLAIEQRVGSLRHRHHRLARWELADELRLLQLLVGNLKRAVAGPGGPA